MAKASNSVIACPKCGTIVDVTSALRQQITDDIRKENASTAAELEKKEKELRACEAGLKKGQEELDEKIQAGVEEKLSSKTVELEQKLKANITKENEALVRSLEDQVKEKSAKITEFNAVKSALLKAQTDLGELQGNLQLQHQEALRLALDTAKSEAELKVKQRDLTIESLNEQLVQAQRTAEEGSSRLIGEAQEVSIEEWLKDCFRYDSIKSIAVGKHGADCLHTVNSQNGRNCGSVYYESKRAENFGKDWIEKLKRDMLVQKADVAVLVTHVFPNGLERMGFLEGVWVCSYTEFKGLCYVLRDAILKISEARFSQENKTGKMERLYDFLTGNEFNAHMQSIISGFVELKGDLDTEKLQTKKRWAQREKQLDKVLSSTVELHGAFTGIAGAVIPEIPQLSFEPKKQLPLSAES